MTRTRTTARSARRLAAGVFMANAVPHGAHALVGRRFPTPFADPPGVGLSSPAQNALWSGMNLAVGALLVRGQLGSTRERLVVAAGAAAMGCYLAHYFGSLDSSDAR